ncbi:flagellar motor protein MotB [Xylanibacillus composti]|uniref:Flagellar motor protein MotB n=1 Tax=Xylanibacillus composti TaxID=1572762 RepID=A0A8J4GYE5_9BACL|nr:flagellar motor protein MotB [Xylanibacillus composti]MDT9725037.1 flagellar motor protein MotB [Xylanibacillus composti]GIQ67483.1 flagellar motor protein MotB [Xylanibacillus composti]
MKKHKQHDHEEHVDESWLIPYADLLTLLLALFIVLFASSQVDQKKFDEIASSLSAAFNGGASLFEPSSIIPINEEIMPNQRENRRHDQASDSEQKKKFEQETVDLQNLKQELDQYIASNDLSTELETGLDNEQLKIIIRDNALYSSGSAEVKPEARNLAVAISDMLSHYPQYEIVVAGHTDDIPIHTAEFPSNWELSAKRALNFMKILLQNEEMDPGRISSVAYGEQRPIATNRTAEGRAANRRVEVSIIRTIQDVPDSTIGVEDEN